MKLPENCCSERYFSKKGWVGECPKIYNVRGIWRWVNTGNTFDGNTDANDFYECTVNSFDDIHESIPLNEETKYMCLVVGGSTPRVLHDTLQAAETEAKRLAAQRKNIGKEVKVLNVVSAFKAKVTVESL